MVEEQKAEARQTEIKKIMNLPTEKGLALMQVNEMCVFRC